MLKSEKLARTLFKTKSKMIVAIGIKKYNKNQRIKT